MWNGMIPKWVACFVCMLAITSIAAAQPVIRATLHITDEALAQDQSAVVFEGQGWSVKEASGGIYNLQADRSPATVTIHKGGYKPVRLQLKGDTILHIGLVSAVTDLPAIVVHSRKLTVADILDSVIAHSDQNYLQPPAYQARLEVSLISPDSKDTFFYRDVPVALVHQKMNDGNYVLYKADDDKSSGGQRITRLSAEQQLRLIDVTSFEEQNIKQSLLALRKGVGKQQAFFGMSDSDSDLLYHIILRYDKIQKSTLIGAQSSTVDADTTMSFQSLIVARSDWSLRSQVFSSIGVSKAAATAFRKADYFTKLQQLIAGSSSRFFRVGLVMGRVAGGKYIPVRNTWEDNLLNISRRLFKKAANDEASVFRYRLMIEKPLDARPPGRLDKFFMVEILQ